MGNAFLAAVAVLLLPAGALGAQPQAPVAACYDEAKADLNADHLPEALAGFKRCLAMSKAPKEVWQMTLAVALTFDLMGARARAHEYYTWFLADTARRGSLDPKWAQRRLHVAREVERLDRELLAVRARLVVTSEPAGASVRVDDQPVDLELTRSTPLTVYLAPGSHLVTVARDGASHAATVRLWPGQRRELAVALAPKPPAPGPRPEPPQATLPTPDPALELAGWTTLGVGGASLVAASVLTALTLADYDEILELQDRPATPEVAARDRELRARYGDRQLAYWTLWTVGGAAVVTGFVLLVWSADRDAPVEPRPAGVAVRF
jgi:hypothetical protein